MDSIFLKNIFRALGSNALGILASAFITLALPRFIGLEEYSYWQLYIFYASYVGFLHLGWSDGFYLINGGKDYFDLDKEKISSNYYSFVLSQLVITSIILLFSVLISGDYGSVFFYIALCVFVTNVRSYSQFILQATCRIKDYSSIIAIEKILLVGGVAITLLLNEASYERVIIVDLLSRLVALIISSYLCREVLYRENINYKTIKSGFIDAKGYISSGFRLMFSFFCGLLIFGLVRYTIEIKWGILAFGEVSLALSLATLFVVFINSIGIVLFPVLRKIEEEARQSVYVSTRFCMFLFLLVLCNAYFPLSYFITAWLPDYKKTIVYLPFIFPILLFEVKVSILTNTFMKVLRKESNLLIVNLFTLFLSFVLSFSLYHFSENLNESLVILIILSAIRYFMSDYIISKYIATKCCIFWIFDALFVFVFIELANSQYGYAYTIITLPLIPLLIYKIVKYKI